MPACWLAWVCFILIIIFIIIFLIFAFAGGGLIRGVNYLVVQLPPSSASVQLQTGTNVMGIGKPTVDQTVVVLGNRLNREGLTFRITNASETDNIMTVEAGSGVTIDFQVLGNEIEPGQSAAFIAVTNNNVFLRYE